MPRRRRSNSKHLGRDLTGNSRKDAMLRLDTRVTPSLLYVSIPVPMGGYRLFLMPRPLTSPHPIWMSDVRVLTSRLPKRVDDARALLTSLSPIKVKRRLQSHSSSSRYVYQRWSTRARESSRFRVHRLSALSAVQVSCRYMGKRFAEAVLAKFKAVTHAKRYGAIFPYFAVGPSSCPRS